YDALALRWQHQHLDAARARQLVPELSSPELIGAYRYFDAQTDDARLVLRVLREAVHSGGTALNYARVETLLRDRAGQVAGVALRDAESGKTQELRARVVINATGAWADELRSADALQKQHLRKLR